MTPTIGRMVHYHTRSGNTLPAVINVTPESYGAAGKWVDNTNNPYRGIVLATEATAGVEFGSPERYVPNPLGPPKEGTVHLLVFGIGRVYQEFNIEEGAGPGQWSWPERT